MKQIVSNYSYSPATNVVTLTGVNIDADQLLLIVAPSVGRTLYNFASVTGTVSAGADTRVTLNASTAGLTTTSPLVIFYDDHVPATSVTGTVALDPASLIALENITVTVGSSVALAAGSAQVGSVTISNFPSTQTIVGTVTANGGDFAKAPQAETSGPEKAIRIGFADDENWLAVGLGIGGFPLPTQLYNNSGDPAEIALIGGSGHLKVAVGNSVTIGSLPAISGTVTAAAPNGSLTTRFGTPTTANTAFATSAVTNANRKYLLIQNVTTGSNVITVGIGFTPTTTQGIQLTAGAGITFESSYIPTGQIFVLSSVTASNFTILEA